MNRGLLLFLGFFLLSTMAGWAQAGEVALAEKYFQDAEWQNALTLYSKIQRKESDNRTFNQRIAYCYGQLEQYDEGIDFLEKVIRKNPDDNLYPFFKAELHRLKGEFDQAENLENKTIESALKTEAEFMEIGSYTYQQGKNALSLKTYLQARKALRSRYIFGSEIANLYSEDGEYKLAAEEYISLYLAKLNPLSTTSLNILNLVSESSAPVIEEVLLSEVQRNSQDLGLRTIVFEFYVLAENFYEAFVQCKSIDKVFKENGRRVYNFAMTMRNNENYKLSNKALDYIIDSHEKSPYYLKAYQEKTVNNELQAFEAIPLDTASIRAAVGAYSDLLDRFGRKTQFFDAMYRKANLQAFYLFDLEGAKVELDKALALGTAAKNLAKANLLYGDILLMQKQYNKAKLKYNEVAEAFKEGQTGALAKYKQGRLSYFKGDFEYSQARLKTIKDNTSNDISNDAIQLFLVIQDNIGLDTSTVALERFSQAQLLVFQREFEPAVELLDSIMYAFPNHGLTDDILWEKANIYLQQNEIERALTFLDKVIENYPTDIHGDDALYTKARINDYTLGNKDEAMRLYIDFLRNYSGSLYVVAVRKRIRELRKEKS